MMKDQKRWSFDCSILHEQYICDDARNRLSEISSQLVSIKERFYIADSAVHKLLTEHIEQEAGNTESAGAGSRVFRK